MELDTPLQCSGGCANCPRMRQCGAAVPPPAEPVVAASAPVPMPASTGNGALDIFLRENPSHGILRIQAFRGNQAIPVKGVQVTVSHRLSDGTNYVVYSGVTDESGLVDAITLPAPVRQQSVEPGKPHPDADYDVTAQLPGFETVKAIVNIFPGIKTVQPVQLQLQEG